MKSNKIKNTYHSKETGELIELAKNGDQRAVNRLYEMYIQYITHEVRTRVWNVEEAEEIIQDTFTKAFLSLDSFVINNAFGLWLRKIAINNIIDHVRKNNAERAAFNTTRGVELSEYHSHNESASDNIIYKETKNEISEAVNNLSWKDRRIYNLRFEQNMSYKDIAEKLGVSVGTIKSHLHKVRGKIKTYTQVN